MWALQNKFAARPAFTTKKHCRGTCKLRTPVRCHAASANTVSLTDNGRKAYDLVWDSFADHVQGEWEGVTVTFDSNGSPQPLPDRFVPSAYRDWGVELFDWQSQSSCVINATPDNKRSVRNIFKKLMPTVGCEADAIAYVEEAEDLWQGDGGSAVKPVTASGSYVAAPAQLPQTGGRTKVEICLAPGDGRLRLRAVLTLMQHWESKQWQVMFVDLGRETYDGPFNGGVELSGCAGGGKPFAKDPPTAAEALSGSWQAKHVLQYACSEGGTGLKLQTSEPQASASFATVTGSGALLLPLGVWVSCSASGADVALTVGMLLSDSERDVAACKYAGGRLQEAVFATECKATTSAL